VLPRQYHHPPKINKTAKRLVIQLSLDLHNHTVTKMSYQKSHTSVIFAHWPKICAAKIRAGFLRHFCGVRVGARAGNRRACAACGLQVYRREFPTPDSG
jgi:hypothetical protein